MSAIVHEIMNGELFALRAGDPVGASRLAILGLGITAAPILDLDGRPIGVVSLRDLVTAADGDRVLSHMSAPATTVPAAAGVREAAQLIADSGHRHLVVVDARGRAIGMLSAVDVVRALIGAPPRHPAEFPHRDEGTGLSWSETLPLDEDHLDAAPEGPGLVALVRDVRGEPGRVVWAEWTHDVRNRLLDWLSLPQAQHELARWLERREGLAFRAAPLADAVAGAQLAETMRPQHLPAPSARAVREDREER